MHSASALPQLKAVSVLSLHHATVHSRQGIAAAASRPVLRICRNK